MANRTTQILEWMSPKQWHYIDTKMNPADCASRGLFPKELMSHELWFHGPDIKKLKYNQFEPLNESQSKIVNDSIKKPVLFFKLPKKRYVRFYPIC